MSREDSTIVPPAQVPDEGLNPSHNLPENQQKPKRKRNKPGNPDPRAKVIALSPMELSSKVDYICETCGRAFQAKQKLHVHERSHDIPWTFQQRDYHKNLKPVYVCPEPTCVHHNPLRALSDITGIKKHYHRKHCERKWQCERCLRMYAVEGDLKAHSKKCTACRCECDRVFPRREEYDAHRQLHHSKPASEEMWFPNLSIGTAPNNNIDIHHFNKLPQSNDEKRSMDLLLWLSVLKPRSNHPLDMQASTMEYHRGDPLPPVMSAVESLAPLYSTNQTYQAGTISGASLMSGTALQHEVMGTGAAKSKPASAAFFDGLLGSRGGEHQNVFQSFAQQTPCIASSSSYFYQDPNVSSSYPFEIPNMEAGYAAGISVGLPSPPIYSSGVMQHNQRGAGN